MSAQLVLHKNPFRIHLDTERRCINHGRSVREYLVKERLVKLNGKRVLPFVVYYNGQPLLEKDWALIVAQDAWLQVSYLPRGGGGSNIGAIIGAIAAAVMAYFTFGLSLVASAAVGVVAYAGMTLLVAGIPKPSNVSSASREMTSPTYSLSAQGNNARLLEAMPRVYGRMRTYPDLASRPYTEFQDNLQYLYQLFCVSLGKAEVKDIFLDDTNITQFEDAEVQIIYPGEAVTLFPDNVVTSDSVTGQEAVAGMVLGPFSVNAPGTVINKIGIDISLPSGAGTVDNDGNTQVFAVGFEAEFRKINDLGNPEDGWLPLTSQTIRVATKQPQFRTYYAEVPEGRYQVRFRKTTGDASDTRSYGALAWSGLRGFMPSTHVYGDITMIAVRMRATATLNQTTARKFSVVSEGWVPVWDPVEGWSAPKFTANPAWVAADILRNQDYGRSLQTSRLNIEKLYALSQTWASRNDEFNGVFDNTLTLWEALSRTLRVGRATPIYYAGVIDFVRDEPQTIARAMFQPANIVEGSFKSVYNFFTNDSPDHVVMEYVDRETWTTEEVECVLPGGTTDKPARVELFGCTSREQAWREGMSLAAGNRDRRRNIEFHTNTAGLIPSFNSLVKISHDSVAWGASGRVLSLNKTSGELVVSERINFTGNLQHVISFRKRDGSQDGPHTIQRLPKEVVPGVGFIYRVVATPERLAEIYISEGVREDYTFFQAGPIEQEGLSALVVSVKPQADGRVAVQLVNYAESVYTAENGGAVPAPPPASQLPAQTSRPIVDEVTVKYTTTIGEQVISATAAKGAIYYEFEALPAGGTWMQLGTRATPDMIVNLSPGEWSVRVRGMGTGQGPWASWTGTIAATSIDLPRMDTFAAFGELFAIRLEFSYAAETASIVREVQIRMGVTDVLGDSQPLTTLPYPTSTYTLTGLGPLDKRYFWIRAVDRAGRNGPWHNAGAAVIGQPISDADILLTYLTDKITRSQLGEELLGELDEVQSVLDELQLTIDGLAIKDYDPAVVYAVNELVIQDGKMYQSLQTVPVGTPPPNPVYWKYIGDFTTLADGLQGLAVQVSTLDNKVTQTESVSRDVWVMQAERRGESEGQLAGVLQAWKNAASIRVVRQTLVDTEKSLAFQMTQLRTEFDASVADVNQQLTALSTAQTATAQAVTELAADYQGNKTVVTNQMTALANSVEAQGTIVSQLKSTVGDSTALISEMSETVATLDGQVSTSTVVKHEVTADGKIYAAGFALGLNYEGGTVESQFLVRADTFAILNQTTGSSVTTSPFMVVDGVTYIKVAMIQNAAIGSAKFTEWLESDAIGPGGVPVLRLNFRTGEIQLNANVSGGGRMTLNNQVIEVFDAANMRRVRMGIWA